ncbi:hypothetical protein N7486_007372 [Penicillium sp. IBT 16267x]|nr:hypothetical protein N7486_007372 [Penicillium sp. IBT 16267x]
MHRDMQRGLPLIGLFLFGLPLAVQNPGVQKPDAQNPDAQNPGVEKPLVQKAGNQKGLVQDSVENEEPTDTRMAEADDDYLLPPGFFDENYLLTLLTRIVNLYH